MCDAVEYPDVVYTVYFDFYRKRFAQVFIPFYRNQPGAETAFQFHGYWAGLFVYDDLAFFIDVSQNIVSRNRFATCGDDIVAFGFVAFEYIGRFTIYFLGNNDVFIDWDSFLGVFVGRLVVAAERISQITHEYVFVFSSE